ncbi:MAG: GntR family transcriptional regulator [Bryobacterales bacterium]|nr:GntR family transcriptional regulator [Bryobacterales bacterium]
MKLRRLTRKRATDEVYENLRDAILNRLFVPGERLQVDEIAERLGVSLTPVRHAIQQLATEGLIEIKPRSGTFVATLSLEDIEATFDVRIALECLAAEKAMNVVRPSDLQKLDELLELLRKPVTSEDVLRKHEKANSELHLLLIEAAGNRRLTEIYKGLNAHLTIARIHAAERNTREDPRPAQEITKRFSAEQAEHEEIVAALKARDLPRMQAAVRKHIGRAKASLMDAWKLMDP